MSDAGEELSVVRFEHDELEFLVLELEIVEAPLPELTASEVDVVRRVGAGLTNAEVASERGVSVRTVANQLRSSFTKLGVSSRFDLGRLLARRSSLGVAPIAALADAKTHALATASGLVSDATVRLLRYAYDWLDLDFDSIRRRFAIPYSAEGELSCESYCTLFEALATMTGRPALGIDLANTAPVGLLGLFEWVGLSAPTLGESLGAMSELGGLLHRGGHRLTRVRGDQLVVTCWGEGSVPPRALLDWAFGSLYLRSREWTHEPPIEVALQYPDPGDGAAEAHFGCPVIYGGPANELVFPIELIGATRSQPDPFVFEQLRAAAGRRLFASRSSPAARLRRRLTFAWANDGVVDERTVARRLGCSVRALHDILDRCHTSFDQLVAEARVDATLAGLEDQGAGLDEVRAAMRALRNDAPSPHRCSGG